MLRDWLETEDVLSRAAAPSYVGTWSVGELVVHLGYGLRMLAEVDAIDREPLTLGRYVAGYAPAQDRIAADTAAVAASLRGRELAGVDRLVAEAWASLDAGLPPVVLGRRGPLRRDDFLRTRLIELVAHGDDLHRVVGGASRSPVLPAALGEVAAVLAGVYREIVSGGAAPPWSGMALVRVATGRDVTEDPAMPLLR